MYLGGRPPGLGLGAAALAGFLILEHQGGLFGAVNASLNTPIALERNEVRVPDGPGLGVELDREKLARYHELFRDKGGYPYDRDPGRPGWFAHVPNRAWADPADARVPALGR